MKAFPNPHRTDELGMTLRDYFAAKAMQAILMAQYPITKEPNADDLIAQTVYLMADAMLKAREA